MRKKFINYSNIRVFSLFHFVTELIPNGRDIPVSLQNMDDYIENVKHALLYTGTRRQFNALKNAFDSLVPLHKLRMFHPEELQTLLCGDDNDIMQWTVDNLRKNVKLEGFTVEDDDIQNLFSELSDASKESRSNFLEFVTGCTRLPVGGELIFIAIFYAVQFVS